MQDLYHQPYETLNLKAETPETTFGLGIELGKGGGGIHENSEPKTYSNPRARASGLWGLKALGLYGFGALGLWGFRAFWGFRALGFRAWGLGGCKCGRRPYSAASGHQTLKPL